MNDINVVMMVYNRPQYFRQVLDSLVNQTVDFNLHVISNNPKHNNLFLSVIDKYKKHFNIIFYEADNSRMTFERWHYINQHLPDNQYIILLDDDMILNNDSIEKIWETKEKNTYKVFQGRQFLKSQPIITKDVWNQFTNDYTEFSYGAANFAIIDMNLLYDVLNYEAMYPELCYKADDLVISWVVTRNNGKILNHKVYPANDQLGVDAEAMFIMLEKLDIYKEYQKLDNIHKFNRF